MSNSKAEFERRVERERDKALAKYGPEGLLPAGNPQLDALDYTINEVVGLVRYAEILYHRREEFPPEFQDRAARLAHRLDLVAKELSLELISLHQGLRKRMDLGQQEVR